MRHGSNFKRCSDTQKRRVDIRSNTFTHQNVTKYTYIELELEDVVAKPETRHQLF